ncbi:MAG: hypothetical protein AB7Q37_01975 [Pyrinomonadaceae bacterium]
MDRWKYIIDHYNRHIGLRDFPNIDDAMREMEFGSASQALRWFVSQFSEINPESIYGCGPCCNNCVWSFIKRLEQNSGEDINNIVVDVINSLPFEQQERFLRSYDWFFVYCGEDDAGKSKFNELDEALKNTDYFRAKLAREEKERRLASFTYPVDELKAKISFQESQISDALRKIEELKKQLEKAQRRKERESYLYDFEMLAPAQQVDVLLAAGKALPKYDGRLTKLISEFDFSRLPTDTIEKLFNASRVGKEEKWPQVVALHRILKEQIDR